MAQKDQSPYPLFPTNGHAIRSDEESARNYQNSKDLRKKKRMKCIAFIAIFAIFQAVIILILALTVLRFKNPKLRINSASFSTFEIGTPSNPSFNIQMNAQFVVKNTNFGKYKYEFGIVSFMYRGAQVGVGNVEEGRVKIRSSKKVSGTVGLSSAGRLGSEKVSLLGSDIGSSGVLKLSSFGKLEGEVELMKMFKKKKSADMNCTMDVHLATKEIQNLICK